MAVCVSLLTVMGRSPIDSTGISTLGGKWAINTASDCGFNDNGAFNDIAPVTDPRDSTSVFAQWSDPDANCCAAISLCSGTFSFKCDGISFECDGCGGCEISFNCGGGGGVGWGGGNGSWDGGGGNGGCVGCDGNAGDGNTGSFDFRDCRYFSELNEWQFEKGGIEGTIST